MLELIQENAVIYLSALVVISEGLAMLPFIKNKGVIMQIIGGANKILKFLKGK